MHFRQRKMTIYNLILLYSNQYNHNHNIKVVQPFVAHNCSHKLGPELPNPDISDCSMVQYIKFNSPPK